MRLILSIVALLLAALLPPAAAQVPQGPPVGREDLFAAERLAWAFLRGQDGAVRSAFSGSLAEQLSNDRLAALRTSLTERGGKLRHVQAAYAVAIDRQEDPSLRRVVVPIDFEQRSVELLITWSGDRQRGLTGFSFRPHAGRPSEMQNRRSEGVGAAWQDPEYANPARWTEQPMQVGELRAMLTVPQIPGGQMQPVPVVVLLGDHAMQGMDGLLEGGLLRPPVDVARGLATLGIASARFEPIRPRNMPYSIDREAKSPARTLLAALARQPELSPRNIHVAGWGTGAMAAADLAAQQPALRGLLLFSPPVVYTSDRYLTENEAIMRGPGGISDHDWSVLRGAASYLDQRAFDASYDLVGTPAGYLYSLAGMRPVDRARDFRGPVLILAGSRGDALVSGDVPRWEALAREEPRRIAVRHLPTLDRWLAGPPAEDNGTRHVERDVVDMITRFVEGTRVP